MVINQLIGEMDINPLKIYDRHYAISKTILKQFA